MHLPLCDFVVIIVHRSANGDWLASWTVILIDFVSVSANGDLLLSLMHFVHVVANFSFVSVSDLVTYVAFCFFVIAIYCLMIIIVNFYCMRSEQLLGTFFSGFPFPISVSDFRVRIPFPAFPYAPWR